MRSKVIGMIAYTGTVVGIGGDRRSNRNRDKPGKRSSSICHWRRADDFGRKEDKEQW